MSDALESTVVFAARLQKLGLGEFINGFTAEGWNTYGEFAFAVNYTPGQGDDTKFVDEVIVPILGEPRHPMRPTLR